MEKIFNYENFYYIFSPTYPLKGKDIWDSVIFLYFEDVNAKF